MLQLGRGGCYGGGRGGGGGNGTLFTRIVNRGGGGGGQFLNFITKADDIRQTVGV